MRKPLQSPKAITALGIVFSALSFAEPAYAGRIVGDFNNDVNAYQQFSETLNAKSIGYIVAPNTQGEGFFVCSSVLVAPTWVLTSAHCAYSANSTKFVSSFAVAEADAFIPHHKYKPGEYLESKDCYLSVDLMFQSSSSLCKNSPEQAIYDLALLRLNRDVTTKVTKDNENNVVIEKDIMVPIYPSKTIVTSGFEGYFVGYGRSGDGTSSKPALDAVPTLHNKEKPSDSDLMLAAAVDKLGGRNYFLPTANGQVFSSDFDDGINDFFNKNIDGYSKLEFEYAPDSGDSGSGLFNSQTNELVGLVAGTGWGRKYFPPGRILSFRPFQYGSLSFYTPLGQHSGWISNVISANAKTVFKPKSYIPTGRTLKLVLPQGGNLAGEFNLEFSDSFITQEFEFISTVYSEVLNDEIYESVFPSVTPSPSPNPKTKPNPNPEPEPKDVSEPSTLGSVLLLGFAVLRYSTRLR